ncbi:MAG: transcription antitermination factor NusB [Saprospirales bacterium]|nr:transcription antitermination factor NusB [Saprospirales bacterium]MBK7337163.1 transcription antitermination factor NusB [Saprospirales bacterium]
MLSRRNVRIKVMQVLYSMNRDENLGLSEAMTQYRQSVNRSFELYLFNLWQFLQAACYSREDLARRNAKLLPTDEDRHFTAILCDNPLSRSLLENTELVKYIRAYHTEDKIDEDITRTLYSDFAKSEEYLQYLANKAAGEEEHTQILLQLYKVCTNSEVFNDRMEDFFPTWTDDKSLVVGSVKKTLKALPAPVDFLMEYIPPKETTQEFGETLLEQVFKQDKELLELIEPALKNWDADRVAIIDMILIKMALIELMAFPTIPTKVTINEFVEISKMYSTDKSKDFINGILDRLMKKLQKEGKILKEGRGLIEE